MYDKQSPAPATSELDTGTFERQPNADYRVRRDKLAAKLNGGVAVLFAAMEGERGFRQDNDFYYLTGWTEPGAALVISDKKQILYLPGQNVSQEKWTGPKLTAESPDIDKITGFDTVHALDLLRNDLVSILPASMVTIYTTPGSVEIQWLQRANAFPTYTAFAPASSLTAGLRRLKDAGELALLRKAAEATAEGLKAAARAIKPGVTENEIASIIEYEYRSRGCQRSSFPSIVASGLNSTTLHYTEDWG